MNHEVSLRKWPYKMHTVILAFFSAPLFGCSPANVRLANHSLTQPERVFQVVPVADLDLSTAGGLRTAQQRIALAAQHICRQFWDERTLSASATYAECVGDAQLSALQQMRALTLIAHDQSTALRSASR